MTAPTAPIEHRVDPFNQPDTAGSYLRVLLGAFSLAAAAIHFAFAPGHWPEDWRHGLFFVLLGWVQVALGVGLLVRARRWMLVASIVVNLGTIGVWAVSRTVGLPDILGGNGEAEAVGNADLLSVLMEGVIVVGSVALLTAPALALRPFRDIRVASGVLAGVITLALVGSTITIDPDYSGHSHAHGDEHDSTEVAAGGDHHGSGGSTDDHAAAGAADEHAAGSHDNAAATDTAATDAAATDDHAHVATNGPWAEGTSPCEVASKGRDPENGDETEGHNHHGALAQEAIDGATRAKLEAEQKLARGVVAKYPTVKAAEADGYRLSTVYLPCIGAHYTKIPNVVRFDPAAPSELLYDGTTPDAKIIGLSYLVLHPGGAPDGFSGPNDVWHQHSSNGGLCLNNAGVVIGGEQMSKEDCESKGGRKNGLKDIWMVHDWVAPGYECSWGVFAAECPELGGVAGKTAHTPVKDS